MSFFGSNDTQAYSVKFEKNCPPKERHVELDMPFPVTYKW
jgi:hypothetical protein